MAAQCERETGDTASSAAARDIRHAVALAPSPVAACASRQQVDGAVGPRQAQPRTTQEACPQVMSLQTHPRWPQHHLQRLKSGDADSGLAVIAPGLACRPRGRRGARRPHGTWVSSSTARAGSSPRSRLPSQALVTQRNHHPRDERSRTIAAWHFGQASARRTRSTRV